MLKKIGIGLLFLVVVYLVVAALRPDHFVVERSVLIKAPPERVFALISDFHAWDDWSPWAHLDPAMKKTLSGAASGTGAIYEWSGNKTVGQGRMEITGSTTPSAVQIKLDFLEPFESHNVARFTLQPQGDATALRWSMEGPSPYISRLMGVFVSMDDMVGKDFVAGLAQIKAIAEKSP
jgi:uncharacterized protein YndB with AHSA1/START domain